MFILTKHLILVNRARVWDLERCIQFLEGFVKSIMIFVYNLHVVVMGHRRVTVCWRNLNLGIRMPLGHLLRCWLNLKTQWQPSCHSWRECSCVQLAGWLAGPVNLSWSHRCQNCRENLSEQSCQLDSSVIVNCIVLKLKIPVWIPSLGGGTFYRRSAVWRRSGSLASWRGEWSSTLLSLL